MVDLSAMKYLKRMHYALKYRPVVRIQIRLIGFQKIKNTIFWVKYSFLIMVPS